MRNAFGYLGRAAALAIGFGATLALAGPAAGKSAGSDPSACKMPAITAAGLVSTLHAINQTEIQAGRKAEERGVSDAVRQYGATLVRDHEAADENLKHYAAQENIDVNGRIPPRVEAPLRHARSELANLSTLGGQAFEHEFASMMLQDQQTAIQLVDRARPSITDPKLKALLGEVEPDLRAHEQIASNILNGFASASPPTAAPRGTAQ